MTSFPAGDPNGPAPSAEGASVDAYVAAHRDRFTLAALRRALLAAGHDPVTIATALHHIPAPASPQPSSPHVPPEAMATRRFRGRIAAGIVAVGAICLFLSVGWWYAQTMSTIGALIAGVLLAFGVGFGFLPAMTALSEKSSRLWRGSLVPAVAATVAAPLLVLLMLTGICVAVSRPIDWLTGGL